MKYTFEKGKTYRVRLKVDNFMGSLASPTSIENRLADWGLRGVARKVGRRTFIVEGKWTRETDTVSHSYLQEVTEC